MIDIIPHKLSPTWKNKRMGVEGGIKRLYKFFLAKYLLNNSVKYGSWNLVSNISYHSSIALHVECENGISNIPFKFNQTWLKDETFTNLVSALWIPIIPEGVRSTTFQFTENIRRVKGVIKEWAMEKRRCEDSELKLIKEEISSILDSDGGRC